MAEPMVIGGILRAPGVNGIGVYVGGDATLAHIAEIIAPTPLTVLSGATAHVLALPFDPAANSVAGTLAPLAGDRAVWDTLNYAARHASDISDSSFTYHNDPAAPPLSAALTNTHILVGNASNVATDVAMSNDATMANTGALTIANQAVTYAKIQNISATQRVLGRNSAGAGSAEEVTASQELDWLGSTRGAILYRGASGWAILAPGTSGDVLTSNGAGADPTYQATIPGAINVYNETYSGNGSTTVFYLANVAAPGTIRVYIDGVRQAASDDTDPTDQVVFSVAPFNGAALLFDYELYVA